MTKNMKISVTVLSIVVFVFIAGWILVSNNTQNDLPIPIGHYIEKDSSSIKLMNALKSITKARKAVVENITNAQAVSYKRNLVRFVDKSTIIVSRDFSQGELTKTDRSLDLAIAGEGFFSVIDTKGKTFFTRYGSLTIGRDGELTLAKGYPLQQAITIPHLATRISIARDGIVSCQISGESEETEIGQILLSKFPNEEALSYEGKNLYSITVQSGDYIQGVPGEQELGEIESGLLESSNVNEEEELRILNELTIFEKQVNKALELVHER